MGPIEDFDFDVAILFSDLLFPLETLGMGLQYEDTGPELGWTLTNETVSRLNKPKDALGGLMFQAEAMRLTRERLPREKSLIGFVGGPWTLYVYAVENGHAGSLVASKSNPDLYSRFLETMLPLLEMNVALQLDAGAEVVMLFDTAAGELSPGVYQSAVAPAIRELFSKFPGRLGYYSKSTQPVHFSNGLLGDSHLAGFGVDHRWDLREALRIPDRKGFVQGNFDQALLFLEPRLFEAELRRFLEPLAELSPAERAGWVCGLGHGVLPKTPEENVRRLVQIVREVFR